MRQAPVIIGGNGHSGTRLFVEILQACGVYMGVPRLSFDPKSKDLNIRGLLDKWVKPYLLGLDRQQEEDLKKILTRRIRVLVPRQSVPWGFKNPRSMFLLPLYADIFPGMRFIHVIRDGRDMCFGNPFIDSPTYWSFVDEDDRKNMSREEVMMKFWGESNRRTKNFGETQLADRYLLVRFEDICAYPREQIERILEHIGDTASNASSMTGLVRKPKSIGRWKEHDQAEVQKAVEIGAEYLTEFGYL